MNVVQSILFFILGFLCAGFLALLVAPSIWRRAVALTRRRIEGSIPLTQAEISVNNQLRAGFAMEARRLEMTIAGLQQKAAGQAVDIGRIGEQLTLAQSEGVQKNETIAALEGRIGALDAEIGQRDEKIGQLGANLAEAGKLIDRRAEDMEKLGQLYDEASFLASNRQIELVARESEIEKLASDMLALRNQRKEMEARSQGILAESRTAQEALRVEQKRVADLDKRIETALGVVADREDKLERREKELARLREKLKGGGSVATRAQETAKRPLPALRADAGAPVKARPRHLRARSKRPWQRSIPTASGWKSGWPAMAARAANRRKVLPQRWPAMGSMRTGRKARSFASRWPSWRVKWCI